MKKQKLISKINDKINKLRDIDKHICNELDRSFIYYNDESMSSRWFDHDASLDELINRQSMIVQSITKYKKLLRKLEN